MKKMLVFLAIAMLAGAAMAQNWGLFSEDRSFVTIGGGTESAVWDNANVFGTAATPKDYGIVSSLILSDFDIYTWKSAGGDVTGGTFNWRVVGDATFQTVALTWQENLTGGDQRWGFSGQNINIAAGKGPGSYQFEFYTEVTGTGDPATPLYDNGGSTENYRGSFQVQAIPEPATMSLLGLGALAMVLRRKIRK